MTTVRSNGHGPSVASSYREAHAQRAHFLALEAERRYRARAAELVDVKAVQRAQRTMARRVRRVILAVPDRVAARLAALDDQHAIGQLITTELHAALSALANEAGRGEGRRG